MTDEPGNPLASEGQSPADSAIAARIGEDLRCKRCGYNLRTLALDGMCPECSTPVEDSRTYFLRYASAKWVRRVAWGLVCLIVALALIALGGAILGAWGAIEGARATAAGGTPGIVGSDLERLISWSVLCFAPVAILMIVALLLLTTPDRTPAGRRHDNAARFWLRRSLWLYVGSTLIGWLFTFTPGSVFSASARGWAIAINAPVGMAIVSVMSVLGIGYILHLMARVPRRGLVMFARIEFWGLLVCGILMTAGQVINMPMTAQAVATGMPLGFPTTTTGPAGPTTTAPATMPLARLGYATPATAPATAPVTRPPSAVTTFLVGQMLIGCASCVSLGFYVGGFILLILAASALFTAAREADQAAGAGTASEPGAPSP